MTLALDHGAQLAVKFAIFGDPRTKKTSQRIVRFPCKVCSSTGMVLNGKCAKCRGKGGWSKVLPSAEHEQWFKDAMIQAATIRNGIEARGVALPITEPVQVTALFYRRVLVGDLAGHLQALGDWLQAPRMSPGGTRQARDGAGIIEDDKLIISWDGSRLRKDASKPRIEVTVEIIG
jgi:hypothetical protein